MQSYKDLIVYQKGYKLALEIYQSTKDFPREKVYSLVSQMRRSAVSISCSELETLISLSYDLNLLDKDISNRLYSLQEQISKLLNSLILSLSKPAREK
jgi:hypothetical protein